VRCRKGRVSDRRDHGGADIGEDHPGEVDRAPNQTSILPAQEPAPDPRLILLERAAARLILFEAGLLDLDEAFQGLVTSLTPRKRKRKRSAT
jgi:hypothetical protein